MGPQDSEISAALLDATERVLRKEGYAAATSRRVAQEAGLKQQLVYYYFHTMNDLLLATFKRRTKRGLERLEAALASDRPLKALWSDSSNTADARVRFEFLSLANRHPGIRREAKRYVEKVRRLQAEAIARLCKEKGVDLAPFTPEALAFLIASASLLLSREEANGITVAHSEIKGLVQRTLRQFE